MGKLGDITSKASNTNRRPNGLVKGPKNISSPESKENLGKTHSPHFMTPTHASKGSITPTPDHKDISSTPIVTKSPRRNGHHFLTRVGLRRNAETPKLKEPSKSKIPSFPVKLTAYSYIKLNESPPSAKSNVSSRDKPLPTPPIAHVDTSDPVKSTVTLIDAMDKPLRCPSAGDTPQDWPTLKPRRTPSGTLQEIMHDSGVELKRQASTADGERYPKLADATHNGKDENQVPTSRYSPPDRYPRKGVSAPELKTPTKAEKPATSDWNNSFQDPKNATQAVVGQDDKSSNMSNTAVAAEKPAAPDLSGVRQKRTSSLRARISSDAHKGRNSHGTDFTDFANLTDPTTEPNRHNSWRQSRHGCNSSAEHALLPKASTEGRAPANFVGGKRRSMQPRRPTSRNSVYEEARPASVASNGLQNAANPTHKSDKDAAQKKARRSSIPVPISTGAEMLPASKIPKVEGAKADRSESHPLPDSQFGIFEDCTLDPPMPAVSTPTNLSFAEATGDDDAKSNLVGLESIDESPRDAYKVRRLSTKHLGYGPKLSISPNADKYIFGNGTESDKENDFRQVSKDSKASKSAEMAAELSGKISAVTQKRLGRPSSSHSTAPKTTFSEPKSHERKARSIDLGQGMNSRLQPTKPISKNSSLITNASSVNDPFYDASEHQPEEQSTPQAKKPSGSIAQDQGWISPLKKLEDMSNQNTPMNKKRMSVNGSKQNKSARSIDDYDPFKYDVSPTKSFQKPTASATLKAKETPKTPNNSPEAPRPKTVPTRRSSRLGLDNENKTASKTFSMNATTREVGPATPLKDFVHRQNNLGSARGHASSQLDILVMPNSKRTSTAHDSLKSTPAQSSLPHSGSKSRFNIKAMFQKRSTEPTSKAKDNKLGKATINANGSPFPPISQVHPVTRTSGLTPRTPGLPPSSSHHSESAARDTTRPFTSSAVLSPDIKSPDPTSISQTTNLAMSLLESARKEQSSPKKEKLLELSKVMVDVITRARDAEKAVEEARIALRKAEVAKEGCDQAVEKVRDIVQGVRAGNGAVV